jgi:hypothetical protein
MCLFTPMFKLFTSNIIQFCLGQALERQCMIFRKYKECFSVIAELCQIPSVCSFAVTRNWTGSESHNTKYCHAISNYRRVMD